MSSVEVTFYMLLVISLLWLWYLIYYFKAMSWVLIQGQLEVVQTFHSRSQLLFGTHAVKIKYVHDGIDYCKITYVRYKKSSGDVVGLFDGIDSNNRISIRVNPNKPDCFFCQKVTWFDGLFVFMVLSLLWVMILPEYLDAR